MSGGSPHRVVVIGGGFGGLQVVRNLRDAPVEITLIDKRNFHLFQPLTYQVATGGLAPGEIAYPLRSICKRQPNARVLLAEATAIDLDEREVCLAPTSGVPAPPTVRYDTLIVACGSSYSYVGHDEWREWVGEVKSLESALIVRGRILRAFEAAEAEHDPVAREAWLTFVIVGGGPTGVEIAGQIAELARDSMRNEFRSSDPHAARILLIEAADRLLPGFHPRLSAKAATALYRLGVRAMPGRTVVKIEPGAVTFDDRDGIAERIPTRTIIWAAGVTASPLAATLSEATGAELDRAGRVTVEPDLTLPGHPEVFAIGDMVRVRAADGSVTTLPGVAPVAMQQGRHVATTISCRLEGRPTAPWRYFDKGNLATIGRGAAVAERGRVRLSGLPAWLMWLAVHLWYLVGFQNRLIVFTRWWVSFLTHGRGSRLITAQAREPESQSR